MITTTKTKKITCLFGEHNLKKYPSNPIALVEAPKTAIYGSLYFGLPKNENDLLWLAVYNKSSFSLDKLKALTKRYVYVFPDLSKDGNTFKEWQDKAKKFKNEIYAIKFIFSDMLEKLASPEDKAKGLDIADYLIKLNWRHFRNQHSNSIIETSSKTVEIPQPIIKIESKEIQKSEASGESEVKNKDYFSEEKFIQPKEYITINEPIKADWSKTINTLETFFNKTSLPKEPIMLDQTTKITDIELFIKSHLNVVKANNGNKTFLPYLERLINFKKTLELK